MLWSPSGAVRASRRARQKSRIPESATASASPRISGVAIGPSLDRPAAALAPALGGALFQGLCQPGEDRECAHFHGVGSSSTPRAGAAGAFRVTTLRTYCASQRREPGHLQCRLVYGASFKLVDPIWSQCFQYIGVSLGTELPADTAPCGAIVRCDEIGACGGTETEQAPRQIQDRRIGQAAKCAAMSPASKAGPAKAPTSSGGSPPGRTGAAPTAPS
jgi:hypothetical protein